MERVSIARVRGGDVRGAVRRAVALVGGMESYLRPGDRVLIKPNLVCELGWRSGGITNPWVTEALVERETCSGCWGGLVAGLERIRRGGPLEALRERLGEIRLCMGRGARPPEDGQEWILFGLCQRRYRERGLYVPGCPVPPLFFRDRMPLLSATPVFVQEEESFFGDGGGTLA